MRWIKKGMIFRPSGEGGWMNSHAQIPTVLPLGDRLRIYFAARPRKNLSLTTFLDVDASDPSRVIGVHKEPILEPGSPGSFDEHGIMPGFVWMRDGQVHLYYVGWSRRASVPYSNWTGLAVSEDGGVTFRKRFDGPILDRTRHEIYSATAPFVRRRGSDFIMWYASGVEWVERDGDYAEVYVVKSATSPDGLAWTRDNRRLLPARFEHEATHRPTVLTIADRHHMWFCHRGVEDFRGGHDSYRIGYAWSDDLREWHREDEKAGIAISESGWDSQMIAYPYVVEADGQVFMFYNGNGFGESGMGYAVLAPDEAAAG